MFGDEDGGFDGDEGGIGSSGGGDDNGGSADDGGGDNSDGSADDGGDGGCCDSDCGVDVGGGGVMVMM